MANRSKGTKQSPVRLLITGVEGVGKTTLASQCPEPLVFDIESGSNQLEVDRVSGFDGWNDLMAELAKAIGDSARTIVIDTVDAAERMLTDKILKEKGKSSVEELGGYGKGYNMIGDAWVEMLHLLDQLVASGKNVVLISHVRVTTITLPDEMGSYSSYALKLSKQVASYTKEWVDAILFCHYRNQTLKDGTMTKVVKSERVIETQHGNGWEAKNRYGLAVTLPLEYSSIAGIFAGAQQTTAQRTVLNLLKGGRHKKEIGEISKRMGAKKPSEITDEIAKAILDGIRKKNNEAEEE